MTLKLTKVRATQWQGNNLGTSGAEWTLAADTDWRIWRTGGGDWVARHPTGVSLRGYTRAILLDKLDYLLREDA